MMFHPDNRQTEMKDSPQAKPCLTVKGHVLSLLGQMLEYPRDDFSERIGSLIDGVVDSFPAAVRALTQFAEACRKKTLSELEEIYTRTFDLAAICSPYTTGYIYGDENFDRGTFMALLGEKYAEMGFDTQGELPDHLAVLLKFAAVIDQETLDELISFCLTAPVSEMQESLRDTDNPYFFVLTAILSVIKDDRQVQVERN